MRFLAASDALVFSSLLPAAVAGALVAAVCRALGFEPAPGAVAFAFFGTFVIYNIDRLRDIERDRGTAPVRTAFVERHERSLTALCGVALAASLASAAGLPWTALTLCAAVLAAGLLHRRLKQFAAFKTAYVTLAWVAVCVGVPALVTGRGLADCAALGATLGMTIAANLIVSNLRDREGAAPSVSQWTPQRIQLGVALGLCGIATATFASGLFEQPRALAAIPALEGLAVAGFASAGAQRDPERYGLAVVDGALLVGALVALYLL